MSDRIDVEYSVKVTGLDEAKAAADSASSSASNAATALSTAKNQSTSMLPTMMMSIRSANAARLAISQTSKAITELNPVAAMYGFLNMIQVVRNLTSLTKMLKDTTGTAAAAQAILATLSGKWWVVPMALAAGAMMHAAIKSMSTGGPVNRTGLYHLHKGEYVVPAQETRLGPIFINFDKQPSQMNRNRWMGGLGDRINESMRRAG